MRWKLVIDMFRFQFIKRFTGQKLRSGGWNALGAGSVFRLAGTLEIGYRSSFGRMAYVHVLGSLKIGSHCFINDSVRMVCHDRIELGDNVLIASGVSMYDHDHKSELRAGKLVFEGYTTAPIQIGSNVWIGDKAILLKGVTIGDNTIIGAGSVVTSNIPANCVAAGNPCRKIREINEMQ
ncbi:MAG: acyltransferase [Saprospiraceae bacterium]|nr:acyltransferase [Saprospiraceae bacterium]